MTHTPGPWTTRNRYPDDNKGEWWTFSKNGHAIDTRKEDNARLIAAAPDLLAAGHHAVAVLADPAATDQHKINEVVNALSDAIAKAEGGAA